MRWYSSVKIPALWSYKINLIENLSKNDIEMFVYDAVHVICGMGDGRGLLIDCVTDNSGESRFSHPTCIISSFIIVGQSMVSILDFKH